MPSFNGFIQFNQGFLSFQTNFTAFHRLLLGFTGFYWVFKDSNELYWKGVRDWETIAVFTSFYWILKENTGFYWIFNSKVILFALPWKQARILLDSTGFSHCFLRYCGSIDQACRENNEVSFYWVLASFLASSERMFLCQDDTEGPGKEERDVSYGFFFNQVLLGFGFVFNEQVGT